jgi:1,4-alpha-glucan branching enzyme
MQGCFSLVLHAHLPFVRHPEHERFLEESWLFEAITESYVPLLQLLEGWQRDGLDSRLTLTLTPTLCAMFQDSLLRQRYARRLDETLALAEKEVHRTLWEAPNHELAKFYLERFQGVREFYQACGGDLVGAFRRFQDLGRLEIITSAATHALLPFLAAHPSSLRAQILVARDHYRECFGRDPRGIWLPECAYVETVDSVLREAGLRWFITDTHGIMHAHPKPRYALFAPLITSHGLAAFGRDRETARQVWSREVGYPGDPRYRDFYRDLGFDLDMDYLEPHLPSPGTRGFTGFKYHRITGGSGPKAPYDRTAAMHAVDEHAAHFLAARRDQVQKLAGIMGRPPVVVSPYDAELFGHWWYEGPEFLDRFVRLACAGSDVLRLATPEDFLQAHPINQVATPAASSWGEAGYWKVWLNEKNEWIYPHLRAAQERMTALAGRFANPDPLQARALRQAARELLLAQASDWPFILNAGTSPGYARRRLTDHLARFTALHDQLNSGTLDLANLASWEACDNLFPSINYRYWLE